VDVHRDSLPRDKTTKEIDDTNYATILFVIGAEHKNFEKNLELATALHKKIEKTYPGLSKGVIQKEGANSNGVYNQNKSDNAILIEVGGFENSLEEMYRTADVFSEVFTEYYWDAEKVSKYRSVHRMKYITVFLLHITVFFGGMSFSSLLKNHTLV